MNIGRLLDLFRRQPLMMAQGEGDEGGYTALQVAAAEAEAAGLRVDAGALAVAETCVGLWERCLASAMVEPMNNRTSGLTPAVLALAGRSLAATGNMVLAIRVESGQVKLLPASHFDTFGDSDPRTWLYHATLTGPSDSRVYAIPAAGVVHFRIGAGAEAPWQGRAPLARSKSTAALAAAVEASLTREARLPLGRVAPFNGTPDQMKDYAADLVKGGLTLAGSQTLGAAAAASGEMSSTRIKPASYGPEPADAMESLRTNAGRDVLSAFGVPPVLFESRGDGAGAREGWRRLWLGTIAPLAAMIQAEIRDKLDETAVVSLEALRAADVDANSRAVARRAQAYKTLTEAGMDRDEARRVAGI